MAIGPAGGSHPIGLQPPAGVVETRPTPASIPSPIPSSDQFIPSAGSKLAGGAQGAAALEKRTPANAEGAPRRPDPVTSAVLKGSLFGWRPEDVKALELGNDEYLFNDGFDRSRDLVALYAHEGTAADPYAFRVDVQDLGYGAEQKHLNTYLLISWDGAPGGSPSLPDQIPGSTDHPWQVAVALYDQAQHRVYAADGAPAQDPLKAVAYNSQYDAVQFALDKDALRARGWKDGQPLRLQAFTTKDFQGHITDALGAPPPWEHNGRITGAVDTTAVATRAKVAFVLHGNQSLITQSLTRQWIDDGHGAGFKPVLDAIEQTGVPVELHVSAPLQSDFAWTDPAFSRRIMQDVKKGLITIEGGVYAEQMMPPFIGPLNQESLKAGREAARQFGQADVPMAWTPERVINSDVLKDLAAAGYKGTIADYLTQWFPDAAGQEHKVHDIHGVKTFFIDHYFQDHTNTNTDGGLDLGLRDNFLNQALSPDRNQVAVGMNDWEFYGGRPFGSPTPVPDMPKAFANNLQWIAAHPWIEPTTPTAQLREGIKAVPHPNAGDLPTQSYLGGDTLNRWYAGGPQDESYANYVPRERGWDYGDERIPSGKRLGDVHTPGTIIHDTWEAVTRAPANALSDLAKKTVYAMLYETAWHDDYGSPKQISGWEVNLAGHLRDATILADAAGWADRVAAGTVSADTQVLRKDIDQDGVDETILSNNQVYAVFDDVGGRLKFAAAMDAQGKPVSLVGNPLAYPVYEGEAEVDRYGNYTQLSGFRDAGRDNDRYRASIVDHGVRLTSSDGAVTKTITLAPGSRTLSAQYQVGDQASAQRVLLGLSPNLSDLLEHGQGNLTTTGGVGTPALAVRNAAGGGAAVQATDATVTATNRELAMTQAVEVTGRGAFHIDLTLEP